MARRSSALVLSVVVVLAGVLPEAPDGPRRMPKDLSRDPCRILDGRVPVSQ
jgi:hypothetical protein